MTWVKGQSGNLQGRPRRDDLLNKLTNRELKERELLMLLRKIKPHVADAIMQAAKIMKNEEAAHQNQLKAAALLLDSYRKLSLDLYGNEERADDEGQEVQQQNAPVFSLRMIDKDEAKSA